MDWDEGRVTHSDLQLVNQDNSENGQSLHRVQQRFREFIRNYREGNLFIYRDQLLQNYHKNDHFLEIALGDLNAYDAELRHLLQTRPAENLVLFEAATKEALSQVVMIPAQELPAFQVILSSDQAPISLRTITAQDINKLVKIPGIVTAASKVRTKPTAIKIECSQCKNRKDVPISSAFGGLSQLPRTCDQGNNECPLDPYTILTDLCSYVDHQSIKLQEMPEVVPTGEMPRSIQLAVDRYLTDRVSPGTRVSVIGIPSTYNSGARAQVSAVAIRTPYIRVLGIQVDQDGAGRSGMTFSPQEEEEFHAIARDPQIYEKLARSIAPSISGDYTKDIKKAIACLLMGGSRKQLPDGMKLRGDVNILLLGDPSTAKSQFLKFVENVSPIGVYTSGKGSSAAGLTASVIRDSRGEFFLEGGAMVLADGGVVCIDEFDKMREADRVAIHEAMEQQTISIAKAGITTILNSRSSVLAAANPIFGRYDDLRSAADNINLMTTILSRFDLIFIVRDIRDEERDRNIAKHVMNVHINAGATESSEDGELDIKLIKRYISYCRSRCAPRLSAEAATVLQNHYVSVRREMFQKMVETGEDPPVPITVRQLEALVRISESLAKMSLTPEASPEHVAEAIRLFKVSTMSAASSGGSELFIHGQVKQDIDNAVNILLRRIKLHQREDSLRIEEEFARKGVSVFTTRMAIAILIKRGELKYLDRRRILMRQTPH